MTERWNPALYSRFEAERTRPARDLLAEVPLAVASRVTDLGCGPGNSTALLLQRFPGAEVSGIDNSTAMLDAARKRLPACRFSEADIADWQPDAPPDLIYANAALHWIPDHATLLPRLFSLLSPGGVLAVQVPDNRDEPSHRAMRDVAAVGAWSDRLARAGERLGVLSASAYYDLLVAAGAEVDVWRTIYHHPMDSAGAIVEWVRSTGLQPFLNPLDEVERAEFLMRYEASLAGSYPVQADGRRLLRFPRLFFTARRVG